MNPIEEFNDTQRRIRDDARLWKATCDALAKTSVYREHFFSTAETACHDTVIEVCEESTFSAVFRLQAEGARIAALNFANPFTPGGGVLYGSSAQEENLCRASNLYNVLIGSHATPYYEHNRATREMHTVGRAYLGNDTLIYSPDITVFKQLVVQGSRRELVYTDAWARTDVITCAAPCFPSRGDCALLGEDGVYRLHVRRVINILEAGIDHGAEILVLGAFGCGAFHNPPEQVARAFRDVLLSERYRAAFRRVTFAILSGVHDRRNPEAFREVFAKK